MNNDNWHDDMYSGPEDMEPKDPSSAKSIVWMLIGILGIIIAIVTLINCRIIPFAQ
jgi:hypothetical protein